MDEMNVVIMRGLPGSGKTTWAKEMYPDGKIVSTDNYRNVDGTYIFDPKTDDSKHLACFREYVKLLQQAMSPGTIIVDNTNCQQVQIAPYYRLAEAYNFYVRIVTLYCTPEIALQYGVHGVPFKTLISMYNQLMSPLPSWWKETVTLSPNLRGGE